MILFGLFGLYWLALDWFGLFDLLWFCLVWLDLECGLLWFDLVLFVLILFDLILFGLFWIDLIWIGLFCFGLTWFGLVCFELTRSSFGFVWLGIVMFCLVWFWWAGRDQKIPTNSFLMNLLWHDRYGAHLIAYQCCVDKKKYKGCTVQTQ
jgi:hypothetical protein